MKLRNTKTQWLALGAMALAASVFALGAGVAWALDSGSTTPPAATPKAGTCEKKATGECKEMGMHAMHNLTEFNKVMANAKALADKGDAKGAATEIAKAQDLMKEGHANMAAKMTERRGLWEKVHKDRLSKADGLITEIQGVQQTLASRPDTKDLMGKLEEIYNNAKLLREDLTHKGVLTLIRSFRNTASVSPAGVAGPEGKTVPVVNEKCPISGKALDREKVPADLRREFKGKPVGFCCPKCPPAWDKLTDAEKQAKLDKVLPPPPPKKESAVDLDIVSPAIYPDPVALPPVD